MVAKGTSAGPSSTAGAAAPAEDSGEEGAPAVLPEYAALYRENPDLFGWVQIPDTDLSYPVMYTPEDPEYYLRRAFDGSDSDSGVPFLDGDCTEDGGNYLIYGHNMNAGTMFALLPSYARQDFWEEHPVIRGSIPSTSGGTMRSWPPSTPRFTTSTPRGCSGITSIPT